jgi:hypothetical protein
MRHFSMKVCKKVEELQTTLYNKVKFPCCFVHNSSLFRVSMQVADDLIEDMGSEVYKKSSDEKNVRCEV